MNMEHWVRVELSEADIVMAIEVASRRREKGITGLVRPRYGADNSLWGLDDELQGVAAEIAVCKHLRVWWPNFGLVVGDVDCGVAEVRSISRPNNRLLMHQNDKPELPYISALVSKANMPNVFLRGWMHGVDGMVEKNCTSLTSGRSCYVIPNEELRPMADLPAALRVAA
jgi:hypothetical protein